jgi:hypothetical protein
VAGDTLDALTSRHGIGDVDFLKMNVEGGERLVIQGMDRLLARTRQVCIACHDFRADESGEDWYRTKALVADYLRGAEFSVSGREHDRLPQLRDQVHGRRD